MVEPLLHVQGLSKQFSNLRVLDDITFDLQAGEIIGLVGKRGAGKSTLLHIIGGVVQPSGGEMRLHGQRVSFSHISHARKQGIEMVHQAPPIMERLDVLNNIFLGREFCWPPGIGVPRWDRMYQRASQLLADFEMPISLLHERTANLSDEQRQIVAVARALAHPCRLLLMDDFLPNLSYPRQQICARSHQKTCPARFGRDHQQ